MDVIFILCFAALTMGCQATGILNPFLKIVDAVNTHLTDHQDIAQILNSKRSLSHMLYGARANNVRSQPGPFRSSGRQGPIQGDAGPVQRGPDDICLMAFMCPRTTIGGPSGDLEAGYHFDVELVGQICNYTDEFLGCFDGMAATTTCGPMSSLTAEVFREVKATLCHTPMRPEILSLINCANNRHLQLNAYGEVMKLNGMTAAYNDVGLPSSEITTRMCLAQGSAASRIILFAKRLCGKRVYKTFCDIEARFLPYLDAASTAMGKMDCPFETFSCPRPTT